MKNLENVLGGFQDFDFAGNSKKARYYTFISQLLEYIHSRIPGERYDTGKVAAPTEIREEIFMGVNYKRAVMFLLSNGCEWALKDGHGCTMCGHLAKQTRSNETVTTMEFLHQFNEEFDKIDFKEFPLLNLYNNGSFFNDKEISQAARAGILKRIGEEKNIKMVVLETRPEFVTKDNIKEVKELLPGKHVEVAIGLEIKDDLYRTVCVNKGFTLKQYEQAARIITQDLHLRTYVLLKPPFLTEKESIDFAVEVIEYAFERGSRTISLEACTVQAYTLVDYLYESDLYSPPYLWSIVEVVKRVKVPDMQKLIVGMFQFYPSPSKTPFNCNLCSDAFLEALRNYNRTLDKRFLADLSCDCKSEWLEALKKEAPTFEKRLATAAGKLSAVLKK
jgi:radical SAM enzyme (TIGR01210 family)